MTRAALKRGRSKASYLLVAGRHVHWFVWYRGLGSDSFGTTVRWRMRDNRWRHVKLALFQRNSMQPRRRQADAARSKRRGRRYATRSVALRPTLTLFELSTWTTRNGTTDRDDVKAYVRLKVGPGGRTLGSDGEAAVRWSTPEAVARPRV